MKIAIITGASSGIGYSTAKKFIESDYKVYNISRSECDLPGVINIKADLALDLKTSQFSELSLSLSTAKQVCLIHNASRLDKDNLFECSSALLRDVCEVNIVGPQKLNELLVNQFPKTSSIIYVGSTLSEKAVAGAFSYVTTKHAQMGMMRATCQDLNQKGIHTAMVCPGFTETEMLRKHLNNDTSLLQEVASNNTFSRVIQPEEIAELIYFAANTPVMNGSVLHGNLGQIES